MAKILILLMRLCFATSSRCRNSWFRCLGMQTEGYVWLRRVSIPRNWGDIRMGAGCALDDHVVLLCNGEPKPGKLVIGSRTYINRFSMIDAHEHVEIGSDCMVGPHCYITDADHGSAEASLIRTQPMLSRPVIIEDNVWLGAGVIVLKGVRIGRSAVIAAGAVVTHDVPPGTLVSGVPARARQHPRSSLAAAADRQLS